MSINQLGRSKEDFAIYKKESNDQDSFRAGPALRIVRRLGCQKAVNVSVITTRSNDVLSSSVSQAARHPRQSWSKDLGSFE